MPPIEGYCVCGYSGDTALMWAADHGDFRIVQLLIAAGADSTIKNNNGLYAKFWAVWRNCPRMLKIFKEAEKKFEKGVKE